MTFTICGLCIVLQNKCKIKQSMQLNTQASQFNAALFLKLEKFKLLKTFEHGFMLAKVNLRCYAHTYMALYLITVLLIILCKKKQRLDDLLKQKLSCSHHCPIQNVSNKSRFAVEPQSTLCSYEQEMMHNSHQMLLYRAQQTFSMARTKQDISPMKKQLHLKSFPFTVGCSRVAGVTQVLYSCKCEYMGLNESALSQLTGYVTENVQLFTEII